LLERANIKFLKVNFKNLFLFYLTVLFCCDVGESGFILKSNGPSSWGVSKICVCSIVNESLSQKLMCVVFYKSKKNLWRKPYKIALQRVDLVRLFLFCFSYSVKSVKCVHNNFFRELLFRIHNLL
jgi:hypothetical protein